MAVAVSAYPHAYLGGYGYGYAGYRPVQERPGVHASPAFGDYPRQAEAPQPQQQWQSNLLRQDYEFEYKAAAADGSHSRQEKRDENGRVTGEFEAWARKQRTPLTVGERERVF